MVVTDSHLDHFLKRWLDQNVYHIVPVKQDLTLACVFTLQFISMGQTTIYSVNIQDKRLMGCELNIKIQQVRKRFCFLFVHVLVYKQACKQACKFAAM